MISSLKINRIALDGTVLGSVDAPVSVFGSVVRRDLIHRTVAWQMAKRRSGNHKTKGISDISGTTKKPHRQKGSGRARQGSLRSPQFRGGAVIFGPVVRTHSFSLPKRVRRQALQGALSALLKENKIFLADKLDVSSPRSKDFQLPFDGSILMVGGEKLCDNLRRATSNLSFVNILPQIGINVLDLIRHDHVVLSQDCLDYLTQFLSPKGGRS